MHPPAASDATTRSRRRRPGPFEGRGGLVSEHRAPPATAWRGASPMEQGSTGGAEAPPPEPHRSRRGGASRAVEEGPPQVIATLDQCMTQGNGLTRSSTRSSDLLAGRVWRALWMGCGLVSVHNPSISRPRLLNVDADLREHRALSFWQALESNYLNREKGS